MLIRIIILFALIAAAPLGVAATTVYQKPSEFLSAATGGKVPPTRIMPLSAAQRSQVERFLGQRLSPARLRYWMAGSRMIVILNSVGRTEDITTGFVVNGGKIEQVKVLIYRESVGAEVRRTSFTNQFKGATMSSRGQLSKRIHNIAGATLSVRSLSRMARAALYLDSVRPK